ncbi:MAG: nicotinate phosphoribosyltransferase [Planctomycetota bacterium]|nr:nicotinate phosphoribosyltransferase [Planctomycetota bacterium]
MNRLASTYRTSLALLTDLYQLTMAYGYWKLGVGGRQAAFHVYFRKNPFGGGYAVACGLADVMEYVRDLRFDSADIDYLASLKGNDAQPLFESGFLDELARLRLTCDVDAIPEGTVVFANEPLVRVVGPILQCQLLETPLLNFVNFQTLVATKAARVCHAARGEPVLEFGLRRAQGIDGSLTAARAAYVGGCAATSNVLAGRLFGIPVRGTHAHSWVMSFDDELESFEAYAKAMPNNVVLLVDTYNTLEGVRRAAQVGRRLRDAGHRMVGIRLDSGDLAYLSIEARKILDDAGLTDAQILASNDLDENLIESLKQQGATITQWGVGTKLVTAYDQPALGGVYKLSAIRDTPTEPWRYKLKLSEQLAKVSTPGVLQVRRFTRGGQFAGDVIYNEPDGIAASPTMVDPKDATRRKRMDADATGEDLLVPIVRGGRVVYEAPALDAIRQRASQQLAQLHPTIRRHVNPHEYAVGLERGLSELRSRMVLEARAGREKTVTS